MSDAPKGWDARRVLYAVLGLQLVMAGLLAGSDVLGALPRLVWPSKLPGMEAPVAPGDQTRRYAPRDTPLPPRAPGAPERPYRNSGDMPARLEFLRTGDTLHLTGEIAPGDDVRFAKQLEAEEGLARAAINSPGGSVRDALTIGRALREAGLQTQIEAGDICFSACPYILAAGVTRRVGEGAQVGVHQHYFGKNTVLPAFLAVSDIQRGQGEVMEYLDDMGVDLRLMRPALATPPEEIYVLLEEEMREWGLVTEEPGSEGGDG
ncbi:hypothetical protein DC366_15060 [Pelagivirga sediminicola]|uniref:Periplasmic protein-like protein n=1 Tax=Pelagivirga sediminicola TaxID=2170575 RepID=A0A2T7G487_9RHOB|nr:hypothetical protein [Pelagivirga sediminicola]PVA09218.1 hypothetical protein DC366_15060 [Pelagivirga sediminicola]